MTDLNLNPNVAVSLALWHEMIAAKDFSKLSTILSDDAIFQSPAVFKPYQGAPVVALILNTVIQVFTDFEYDREFSSADGANVVLEFKAKVDDKLIHGIDMIRFNEAGLITEFTVMIRPMSALQTLAAEMGARLAPYMPAK